MHSGQHVEQHRLRFKQRKILKSPRDAEPRSLMWSPVCQRLLGESDLAGLDRAEPAHRVEDCCFASPVGAYQRAYLPGRDREAQSIKRFDAAKAHAHLVEYQDRLLRLRRIGKPLSLR